MRLLLTTLAALTLAGCQAPSPADNTPQPNEAAVEAYFDNQQAGEAEAIQNDAEADNINIDTE